MQNGTYACRFNMLGYRKDKEDTEPRIIPEEAQIVRNIFKMYDEGYSLDQLKAYLEDNGVKTTTGKTVWSKENIKRYKKLHIFFLLPTLLEISSPK